MIILVYQAVLFLIELDTGGSYVVTLVLGVWTLTHIFMPWLMALQFVTIGLGFCIGRCWREA